MAADASDDVCPVCCEPLEPSDRVFFPCTCGFQVCMFCWKQIRDTGNGACPACRRVYTDDATFLVDSLPSVPSQAAAGATRGRPRPTDRASTYTHTHTHARTGERLHVRVGDGQPRVMGSLAAPPRLARSTSTGAPSKSSVRGLRVVQRSLVYVVGLTPAVAREAAVRATGMFGQYGKITSVVITKLPAGPPGASGANVAVSAAYITYTRAEDAKAAILASDGAVVEGRVLRCSYGTTKYCAAWLRDQPCTTEDCLYLHDFGAPADSFSREEMIAGNAFGNFFADLVHPTAPPDVDPPVLRKGYLLPSWPSSSVFADSDRDPALPAAEGKEDASSAAGSVSSGLVDAMGPSLGESVAGARSASGSRASAVSGTTPATGGAKSQWARIAAGAPAPRAELTSINPAPATKPLEPPKSLPLLKQTSAPAAVVASGPSGTSASGPVAVSTDAGAVESKAAPSSGPAPVVAATKRKGGRGDKGRRGADDVAAAPVVESAPAAEPASTDAAPVEPSTGIEQATAAAPGQDQANPRAKLEEVAAASRRSRRRAKGGGGATPTAAATTAPAVAPAVVQQEPALQSEHAPAPMTATPPDVTASMAPIDDGDVILSASHEETPAVEPTINITFPTAPLHTDVPLAVGAPVVTPLGMSPAAPGALDAAPPLGSVLGLSSMGPTMLTQAMPPSVPFPALHAPWMGGAPAVSPLGVKPPTGTHAGLPAMPPDAVRVPPQGVAPQVWALFQSAQTGVAPAGLAPAPLPGFTHMHTHTHTHTRIPEAKTHEPATSDVSSFLASVNALLQAPLPAPSIAAEPLSPAPGGAPAYTHMHTHTHTHEPRAAASPEPTRHARKLWEGRHCQAAVAPVSAPARHHHVRRREGLSRLGEARFARILTAHERLIHK